jgi:glucokinase
LDDRPDTGPTERGTMHRRLVQTLLGDIGATNARFSLLMDGTLGPVTNLEVGRYARFADAVTDFLQTCGEQAPVTDALFAVAGPVEGDRCRLTNCPWIIDGAELRAHFRLARVRIVNDFAATAYSLPSLAAADLHPIGGGHAVPGAPMAVLGPGTGLGVAGLVPGAKEAVVIAGEGGHTTIAGASRREDAVIDHLRGRFGHVSAERVVSGSGLENLYEAIAALDRSGAPARDAAEITRRALDGSCPTAVAALEMFCALLGAFSGNIALMLGARGGVHIAGGIAPRILGFLERSEFRRRFEDKGRFRSYLEAIPLCVIVHPAAAFLGLAALAASESSAAER